MQMSYTLASIFGGWGFVEFAALAILGVLIFGRRLPEVGKNLGRSIVEFKKGLSGAGEAFADGSTAEQPSRSQTIPAQTVPNALPSAVSPSTDEQLRKQQQEVERLSEELRQLRQQMAEKDAK